MTTHLRLDPASSSFDIHGSSSVHPIDIRGTDLDGWLEVDDSDASSLSGGRLTVPAAGLRTGQPLQDLELRRQIRSAAHPDITAVLEDECPLPAKGAVPVSGHVTFLGVDVPAAGVLQLERLEDCIELSGTARFDVRDFGLKPPRVLGLRVHPEVDVTLRARFTVP